MKKPKPPARKSPPQNSGNHTHISVQAHKWDAPIPPPSILAEFDNVVQNGAERIVRNWEIESQHRRNMERTELSLHYWDAFFGRFCAMTFVLAALAVSAYCASIGAEWMGVVLGGGTIASVVGAFVYRQKRKP